MKRIVLTSCIGVLFALVASAQSSFNSNSFGLNLGFDTYQRYEGYNKYSGAYFHVSPSVGAAYTFRIGERYGIQVGLSASRRIADSYFELMPTRVSELSLTIPVMLTSETPLGTDERFRFTSGIGFFLSTITSQKTLFPEYLPQPETLVRDAKAFGYGKIGPCVMLGFKHAVNEHVDVVAKLNYFLEFERSVMWGKSFQNFAYNGATVTVGFAVRLGKAKSIQDVD